MAKRKLWEQRENEPANRFLAFTDYLNMRYSDQFGKRSLAALATHYRERNGKAEGLKSTTHRLSTLQSWCLKHEWVKRVEAYDAEQILVQQKVKEKKRQDLIEWSETKARDQLQTLYDRLDEVVRVTRGANVAEIEGDDGVIVRVVTSNVYHVRALINLADELEKHRRRVLDMPTDITEQHNVNKGFGALLDRLDEAQEDIDGLEDD